MLAAVVVTLFAFSGKDAVLTLFKWFTNLGVLGIILLPALTSAAVVAYFARDHRGENARNRLIAPVAACVELGAVFVANLLTLSRYSTPKRVPRSRGCCPDSFSSPPCWA